MITRVIKVQNSDITKGFITHADQEKDGLKFGIVYSNDTHSYVFVQVDDKHVAMALAWKDKVGGEILTVNKAKAEVQADITAKPVETMICSMGYEHTIDKVKMWKSVLIKVNNI